MEYTFNLCEEIARTNDGASIFCICNDGQWGHYGVLGAGTDGNIYCGSALDLYIESRNVFNPDIYFTSDFMNGKLSADEYARIAAEIFDLYANTL